MAHLLSATCAEQNCVIYIIGTILFCAVLNCEAQYTIIACECLFSTIHVKVNFTWQGMIVVLNAGLKKGQK